MHVRLSALIASSAVDAAGTAVTAAAGGSEYRSGGGRRGQIGAGADARVGLTERSVCVLGGRVVPPRPARQCFDMSGAACQFQVLSPALGRPAADAGGRLRVRHYRISIYGPSTGRGGASVRVHAAPDFKFHGCESWRGRSAAAAAASRRFRGLGALQRRRYSAMARNFVRQNIVSAAVHAGQRPRYMTSGPLGSARSGSRDSCMPCPGPTAASRTRTCVCIFVAQLPFLYTTNYVLSCYVLQHYLLRAIDAFKGSMLPRRVT